MTAGKEVSHSAPTIVARSHPTMPEGQVQLFLTTQPVISSDPVTRQKQRLPALGTGG
jgi:hypothetical protein